MGYVKDIYEISQDSVFDMTYPILIHKPAKVATGVGFPDVLVTSCVI